MHSSTWLFTVGVLSCAVLQGAGKIEPVNLVMSHVIWRHGDRSPSDTYPTDIFQESAWPQGWQQLTQYGMQQIYRVGQLLRDKYVHEWRFLDAQYNRNQVYVRSSDVDRSIQSAQMVLAGLYPPSEQQVWNTTIPWQPIPVHVFMPEDEDVLLKPTTAAKAHCPLYNSRVKSIKKRMEQLFNDNNQALIEYTHKYSGYKHVSLDDVSTIASASTWERVHNMTQPAWLDAPWQDTGKSVYEIMYAINSEYTLVEAKDPLLAKLLGGLLLDQIAGHMISMKNGTYPPDGPRMTLYSAHSGTLMALLEDMDVHISFEPPTATVVMLDMYYAWARDVYLLQMSWSLDTRTRHVLPMHACAGGVAPTGMCTLRRFLHAYTSKTYASRADWDAECKKNDTMT